MGLGLAIGADALRACKAFPGWRGLRLTWWGAAPVPRELIAASPCDENIGSVAGFRRLLTEMWHGLVFPGRVQVGLPDPAVRVRLLFTDNLPPGHAERRKLLLWRLADALDVRPRDTRLAYMAFPSPLPDRRHAVLCAVTGQKVLRQYERALAESKVRYSRIAPSSVLLFNLFNRFLTEPPGVPVLLLAATEASATTILTVNGSPIFWRTRPLARRPEGPGAGSTWRGEVLRAATEAINYGGDELGVAAPARVLVAGPLAEDAGLAEWLARRIGCPVADLDAGRLVRRGPRRLGSEGWSRWGVALGAASRP